MPPSRSQHAAAFSWIVLVLYTSLFLFSPCWDMMTCKKCNVLKIKFWGRLYTDCIRSHWNRNAKENNTNYSSRQWWNHCKGKFYFIWCTSIMKPMICGYRGQAKKLWLCSSFIIVYLNSFVLFSFVFLFQWLLIQSVYNLPQNFKVQNWLNTDLRSMAMKCEGKDFMCNLPSHVVPDPKMNFWMVEQ